MKQLKKVLAVLLTAAMLFGMIPVLFASAADKPAVPTGVKAAATGANQITVSWNAVANATQYNIYRYNAEKSAYVYYGTTFATSATPTKYVNGKLIAGTVYYYKVVSVIKNAAGTYVSDFSASANARAIDLPAVPQNVKAKANGADQITITWNAVTQATQYNIFRYNAASNAYVYKGTTFATVAAPTQYIDKGLTAGTTYRYKVVSVDKNADHTLVSDYSAEASAATVVAPAVPSGVSAFASGANRITVKWNAVTNATQYNIYRYNGTKKEYVYKGTTFTTAAAPTQYIDSAVVAGTSYYYKVVSVIKTSDYTLVSDMSGAVSAKAVDTPAIPQGVQAKATGNNRLTISWDAVANVTQYNIFRYNGAKKEYIYKGTTFATANNPTQYIDSNVVAGTSYYYKVVSVNKTANYTLISDMSAAASAKAIGLPSIPQNVHAAATGETRISITWNAVADATQYNIFRCVSGSNSFVYRGTRFAASETPTLYNDTGLTPGTTYRYQVVSVNKTADYTLVSDYSAETSATTPVMPATPDGVRAFASGVNQISVTWTAVDHATQYNVYRYNGNDKAYNFKGAVSASDANPTRFIDNTAVGGTTYYYKVAAVNKTADYELVSAFSGSVNAPAVGQTAVPTNVAAAATGEKQITVTWDAVAGATQYNIFRYDSAKNDYIYLGTKFASAAAPTQYINTNLTVGTAYSYKIAAVNKTADYTIVSALSAAANATAIGKPAVPQSFRAEAVSHNRIILRWNAVADATQYNIFRYSSSSKSYVYLGTTFSTAALPTQYINSGLTPDTVYSYKITAVNKTDAYTLVGDYSSAVEAKTFAILPLQATDVSLSARCFQYDGTVKQPVVTVTVNGTVLTKGTDYTVTFSGACVENGAYTVSVTGIGGYSGTTPEEEFVITATGHTPEPIPAAEATCTEGAHDDQGIRCSYCGEILKAPGITSEALGHDMTETAPAKATCLAAGTLGYFTCEKCNKVFVDADGATETTVTARALAQLSHSFTGEAVSNGNGTHSFLCVNGCGNKGEETVECSPYKTKTYPATCEAGAYEATYCVCEAELSRVDVEGSQPLGHIKVEHKDRTCLEDAYDLYDCDRTFTVRTSYVDESLDDDVEELVCGYYAKIYGTDPNDIAPGSHDLSEDESAWTVVTAPTCSSVGVESQSCKRCGEVCTREIDTIDHPNLENVYDPAPTCTTPGIMKYKCVVCGFVLSEVNLPAQHTLVRVPGITGRRPTCAREGFDIFECSNPDCKIDQFEVGMVVKTLVDKDEEQMFENDCGTIVAINGDTYTLDFSILGTDYEGFTVDYTSSELSRDTIVCEVLPTLEHTIKYTEVQPRTCEQEGIWECTSNCEVCGAELEGKEIHLAPLGHNPNRDAATCTESKICTRCEEILEEAGHIYSIPNCAISDKTQGFYCVRCGKMPDKDERVTTLAKLLNQLKDGDYIMPDPTVAGGKTVTAVGKEKMSTSYTTFDFGLYTSVVKSFYEKEVSGATVKYEDTTTGSIADVFSFPGEDYVIKTDMDGDPLLTANDLDSIKVETINGFNVASLVTGFNEKDENDRVPEITQFNKTANEKVLRVTIDLKNEFYSKNQMNIDDSYTTGVTASGKPYKIYNNETFISKVFNYDIRKIVDSAEFNNDWAIVEGGDGEGYEMKVQLNSIKADAKVVYYFAADDYAPIAAAYHITDTMNQELTMKILTVEGLITPVVVNDRDYVYMFNDYFQS